MKRLLLLFIFLSGFSITAYSQNCKQTCTIEKEIGEGVFLGVQINSSKCKNGTKVIKVIEGTQAEKMGLQTGDIIHTINGDYMETSKFMVDWVQSKHAGMPVKVQFERDGKEMTLSGKLGYQTVKTVEQSICCDDVNQTIEVKKLDIYPNPNRGQFQLQSDWANDEPVDMKILDLRGGTVYENTIYPNSKHINESIVLNQKLSGEFVLVLQQNNKSISKKIVFIR